VSAAPGGGGGCWTPRSWGVSPGGWWCAQVGGTLTWVTGRWSVAGSTLLGSEGTRTHDWWVALGVARRSSRRTARDRSPLVGGVVVGLR
jgi:hypothetical protein